MIQVRLGFPGVAARERDELIGVAFASDRAEASMIQGLLESAGIPSAVQQLGIDGPRLGFGLLNPGGGAQRVMVRSEQAEAARALLAGTVVGAAEEWSEEFASVEETGGRKPRGYGLIGAYTRAWILSLGIMALAFGVFLLSRVV